MKKNTLFFLAVGILLTLLGGILCYQSYRSSYADSLQYKKEVSALTEQLKEKEVLLQEVSDEAVRAELEADQAVLIGLKNELNDKKLSSERPYSYSLTLLFAGIILTAAAFFRILRSVGKQSAQSTTSARAGAKLNRLAQASLMAALCYIGFAFLKFDIPIGTESTAFHFGNVFCVLAALLLGGFWGGLAGAVGMTIGDLTTVYVTSAPKTFLLKFFIGLIVGFVAHRLFHLSSRRNRKQIIGITVLASVCGMGFNIIADPLVGYLYKTYLLGLPQDLTKTLLKIAQLTTTVNAAVAVVFATLFYLALRPALKKAGLLATENATR